MRTALYLWFCFFKCIIFPSFPEVIILYFYPEYSCRRLCFWSSIFKYIWLSHLSHNPTPFIHQWCLTYVKSCCVPGVHLLPMCLTLNVLVCLPPPLFMFFSHKGYILNIHLEYSCRRQSDFIVRIKPICILHKRLSYPPSHGPSHPHPHDFYTLILSPTTISFTTSTFRVKHVLYNYKLFQVTVQGLMQKGSAFRKLT